jgi:hypothetical protein
LSETDVAMSALLNNRELLHPAPTPRVEEGE